MQPMELTQFHLPKTIIDSMNAAVTAGHYSAPDEIVLVALEQWQMRQHLMREELGKLWDEGVGSGQAPRFTLEEILSEVRAKRTAR